MIQSISIKNLFDTFNYDISFENDDNVLIITGPNGYGKTMILNIIFNLFNQNFVFFESLMFEKITLNIEKSGSLVGNRIEIDKTELGDIYYSYYEGKEEITSNDLASEEIYEAKAKSILNSISVHLIEEQRLYKKINSNDLDIQDNEHLMVETIQSYANDLKKYISDLIQKSFNKSQELESNYLDRLIDGNEKISAQDYLSRLTKLIEKQDRLIAFGIYETKQNIRGYSEENAKALLVYINDLEQKLMIFDEILEKLELFTSILNERRLTFKTIYINKNGFYFKTNKNEILDLTSLSSGEQHEVVLLYELIFKIESNTLVLIDEPEISLHISWQKEFLKDLLRIIETQNIQVIVATHAPAIINDRWDLVCNLATVQKNG